MIHKDKEELKATNVIEYIKWGGKNVDENFRRDPLVLRGKYGMI
jgi:hypothetical protein